MISFSSLITLVHSSITMNIPHKKRTLFSLFVLSILVLPILVSAECKCDEEDEDRDRTQALKFKIVAIASIVVASAIGILIPMLGKVIPALSPEKDIFFFLKAFAAGVILGTGFVHVLPEAFVSLTSHCLSNHPWGDFPFSGFVAMCTAMGTLMVDAFATRYFNESHVNKGQDEVPSEEGHLPIHTHTSHGHALGSDVSGSSDLLCQGIISQVLEVGIVVHSVIIGISLGASESPKAIKPLIAALTFDQFFEGMGLGSCITEAKFKSIVVIMMALFFSLTTPAGIAIGLGISNVYDENSPTALVVAGILNAASAGILIYMALVDLLAADFMNPRMQNSIMLQMLANVSLLLGAGLASLLAKWA